MPLGRAKDSEWAKRQAGIGCVCVNRRCHPYPFSVHATGSTPERLKCRCEIKVQQPCECKGKGKGKEGEGRHSTVDSLQSSVYSLQSTLQVAACRLPVTQGCMYVQYIHSDMPTRYGCSSVLTFMSPKNDASSNQRAQAVIDSQQWRRSQLVCKNSLGCILGTASRTLIRGR